MVKNLGGNKAKRQGRKHVAGGGSIKLRLSEEDGEIYAVVTKIYGATADIMCLDHKTRSLVIRKKFKGRNKRDNTIAPGSWVLAGKRDWESRKVDSKEVCDLLEVYSTSEVLLLKQTVDNNWTNFTTNSQSNMDNCSGSQDEVTFVDAKTQEYEDEINNSSPSIKTTLDWLKDDSDDSDDLNIDDL